MCARVRPTVGWALSGFWARVLQMVSEHQPSLHGRVRDRGAGIWRMARVVPEWTHGMAYVPALDARTCTEGWFWAFAAYAVCCRGRQPLRGGECNTSAYSYAAHVAHEELCGGISPTLLV